MVAGYIDEWTAPPPSDSGSGGGCGDFGVGGMPGVRHDDPIRRRAWREHDVSKRSRVRRSFRSRGEGEAQGKTLGTSMRWRQANKALRWVGDGGT
jgi:hypothetical protein